MTEEDSEIRLVKDEPKVVFKRFKNNLLDNLPADKPEFIKLLEKKDIVGEKSRRKLNTPNQKRIVYAGCVLQEIDTLEFSDEKFYKLLSIMKEYNNGLQTLVQEIEAYLDPVGGHFDCMAMHHYLCKNSLKLEKLPYDQIQYDLITHDVIVSGEEILNIGFKVIENIQRDLCHNQANKFKVFLQIMEDSDVLHLQNTAKRLGGSQRITEDLPVPNNVRATVLSDSTSVEVTWDQLSEATEYTIFYKIPFIFNFSHRSDDSRTVKGASTTSYILTNLEGNTPYIITVQATGSNGRKSALSNQVSITTAIPPPKPGDKRKDAPTDSNNDATTSTSTNSKKQKSEPNDDEGDSGRTDEVLHKKKTGKNYFEIGILKSAQNAVCRLDSPESTGTGFIGKMKFEDETESTVLVTCFHVIIEESHGLSDIEAQDIDENTRTRIEKHAKRFQIISTPKPVKLSDILEGSCKVSPRSSLDYFIMKINITKLKSHWKSVNPIDLNKPADIAKNNSQIFILQYPLQSKNLHISASYCNVVESGNSYVIHRMVYNAGTEKGSSGGAILMEKDHKLVIAGLHRGCEKIDLEQKGGDQEYNYGSLFSEISESVTNNEWHLKLSAPTKGDIRKAVSRLY